MPFVSSPEPAYTTQNPLSSVQDGFYAPLEVSAPTKILQFDHIDIYLAYYPAFLTQEQLSYSKARVPKVINFRRG
jgi:hypothetical protein